MRKIMQKRQYHLPSVGGKAPLPQQARTASHTTNNRLPHDDSEKSRRIQLEESPKGAQLPGRDNQNREASPQRKRPECHPLVGRRVIRHLSRSKRTNRGNNLHSERVASQTHKKQKINATSSTISELVGVHEASPQVFWKRHSYRTKVSK